MNKNFAKIAVPAVAVALFAAACTESITQPGTTAGMMPDTVAVGQRAPIDTFAVAPRMPDTVAVGLRAPIDTFAVAPRMPDTVAVAQRISIDSLY